MVWSFLYDDDRLLDGNAAAGDSTSARGHAGKRRRARNRHTGCALAEAAQVLDTVTRCAAPANAPASRRAGVAGAAVAACWRRPPPSHRTGTSSAARPVSAP